MQKNLKWEGRSRSIRIRKGQAVLHMSDEPIIILPFPPALWF